MASEIQTFTITIPANTAPAAAITTDTSFNTRIVEGIEILLPRGLNGSVGIQILSSRMQAIPANAGSWIIGSGEVIKWPLEEQITSGSWQVRAYNTGRYSHTFFVRYLLQYPNLTPGTNTPALISNAALSSAPAPDLNAALDLVAPIVPEAL